MPNIAKSTRLLVLCALMTGFAHADEQADHMDLITQYVQRLNNLYDGTWAYTPAANDTTSVSFGYTISDGYGGTVAGSATLDLTPVNDSPTTALMPQRNRPCGACSRDEPQPKLLLTTRIDAP